MMSPIDIRPSPTFNMIKILQGYTNRVRCANYIYCILKLQISCSVNMQKIMTVDCQYRQRLLQ